MQSLLMLSSPYIILTHSEIALNLSQLLMFVDSHHHHPSHTPVSVFLLHNSVESLCLQILKIENVFVKKFP